ncbi:MAG: UPF0158 family protein [Betaproteobacteria bacterium]|nr:UPF0158 family protein [Betaproteobacteria bacterium]MDH3436763.1 UPF0158 family protein [Betaproteobacteria bacterium]
MARAKFDEIMAAFEFVSLGPPMEHAAYLSKETGTIYWHSEFGDNFEELPADIDEEDKYLSIPHKNDFGLGKRLAIQFAEAFLADDVRKVREIFRRQGAYARFKDLLEHREMLNRWYEFEASAQKEALLTWCQDNGVEIDG